MIQLLNEFGKEYHNLLCGVAIVINSVSIVILSVQMYEMKKR